ncbi:MFS transporter [Mucilaginibacter agri]|uniref:MFS transporter n=1 Tax=Mucilaginibacter agri TaxID=2695265 RepID=A0A965ZLX8_9SPHI|nr:MFS transporter [Mucilaginibacter agri]NCD72477.1 MFS transporter [Mucilaginibacter agri]
MFEHSVAKISVMEFPIKRIVPIPNLVLGTSCMLLMFQAYLIAPLQLSLATEFDSSLVNLGIPAFAIGFALAAGAMDSFWIFVKPAKIFLMSLVALCLGTLLLSTVKSAGWFLLIKVLTGLGTGAMLPSVLIMATNCDVETGSLKNLTFIIFALATGMTLGPSTGGWLNESLGWRSIYCLVGVVAGFLCLLFLLDKSNKLLDQQNGGLHYPTLNKPDKQARYIYTFVFLTGVFHSGVFVWVSYYFTTQYGLDEFSVANVLFIFGLPGLVISILMHIYRIDNEVIKVLYPGFLLTLAGLFILMMNVDLWLAKCLLAIISVGFSCTQPLFIGIIKLPRPGISVARPLAKGCGILFAGYGIGPVIMLALLDAPKTVGLGFLVLLVVALAIVSPRIWNFPKFTKPALKLNKIK